MNSIRHWPRRQLVVPCRLPWQDGDKAELSRRSDVLAMNFAIRMRRILTRSRGGAEYRIRAFSVPQHLCVSFLFLTWLSFFGTSAQSVWGQQKDSIDRDYAGELPRIAPT